MQYPSKTPSQISSEYFHLVDSRAPLAISEVKGALKGLELEQSISKEPPRLQIEWVLRAHIGTLEKLPLLLPRAHTPSSLQLLSATRNLFENIVWLRLFEKNSEYGSCFYAKFLNENCDDIKALIDKVNDEIRLFEHAEEQDKRITEAMIGEFSKAHGDEGLARSIASEHNKLREELDRTVRQSFSLYAASSKFNGYAFQIHLLKTKELPRLHEHLAKIENKVLEYQKWLGKESLYRQYSKRFNWRDQAKSVGMLEQYDYLYRLSSRLLHAGPMNIITEKELSESEQMVLLEYMVVAAEDAINLIQKFDFLGRVNMLYVET